MKIAIVIPVHGAIECVGNLLSSIDNVTPLTNIVLVDDASDKETSQVLLDFTSKRKTIETIYLRNDKQQLFTRSVNRGLRYAVRHWNPDAIICINTDCTLKSGWYECLVGALGDYKVGIVGYRDNYKTFPECEYSQVKSPNYVTGHCFIMRTKMIQEIGLLCETDIDGRQDKTLAHYHGQAHIGSERILCNKANIYGWETLYANKPLVEHGVGNSWHRNLKWLHNFVLEPLWEPCDTLEGGFNE